MQGQSRSTFCSFCVAGDYIHAENIYEDITDGAALKKHMQDMLEEYNSTPGVVSMDLVLFRDAIEHGVCCHVHISFQSCFSLL